MAYQIVYWDDVRRRLGALIGYEKSRLTCADQLERLNCYITIHNYSLKV